MYITVSPSSPLCTAALDSLENEIVPDTPPVAASAKITCHQPLLQGTCIQRLNIMYIQLLCILQFYLSAIVDHVDPRVKSAAIPFQRPVSTGTQTYGTNPNNYPITQPMTKMTALLQVYISCCYTMCSVCTHMNFCAISPYFILGLR